MLSGSAKEQKRPFATANTPLRAKSDMRTRALEELSSLVANGQENSHESTAVVETQSIQAMDPVESYGLALGLTLQPYSAKGHAPMVALASNDLKQMPSTTMFGVEMELLPWRTSRDGSGRLGLRFGFSYAKQTLKVYNSGGSSAGLNQLHSLHSFLLASHSWLLPRTEHWNWLLAAGGSRFDLVQVGPSTLSEASDTLWLLLMQTGPSWKAGDISLSLNYERRFSARKGRWAQVAQDTLILGARYELR